MESEEHIELELSCWSSRQDVALGCGVSYENDDQLIDHDDVDWILCGITECFWENYFEFAEGIAAAKAALAAGEMLTLREALYKVFGVFNVEYKVNGESTDFEYGVDVEEIIYDLLIENSDI